MTMSQNKLQVTVTQVTVTQVTVTYSFNGKLANMKKSSYNQFAVYFFVAHTPLGSRVAMALAFAKRWRTGSWGPSLEEFLGVLFSQQFSSCVEKMSNIYGWSCELNKNNILW